MQPYHRRSLSILAIPVLTAMLATPAGAADLPKATQAILKAKGLGPETLKMLDKELAVPSVWHEAAKKEGTLHLRLNLSQRNFTKFIAPFKERYPGIDIEYVRGVGANRATRPLMAFKVGNYIADVLSAFGSNIQDYRAAKAMADLRSLPAWDSIPDDLKAKDGFFAGWQKTYWCMSYNKNKVKESELPKTWYDFVKNPRWFGGKVGLGNRAHLWLVQLHATFGDQWYEKDFMPKFFDKTRPQLRKEGINGLMKLASLGEFEVAIPSAGYRVKIQAKQGVPIGYHCPEPAPLTFAEIGYFNGTPRLNGAKLFVNWGMSSEGQLALNNADFSVVSNKYLDGVVPLPYPNALKGKKVAVRTMDILQNTLPKTYKTWNKMWLDYGGPSRKKRGKK